MSEHPESGSPPAARPALIQIIEGEIIPRLYLAHRNAPLRTSFGQEGKRIGPALELEPLAELFLRGDTAQIVSQLLVFTAGGIGRDRLYFDLLAPVSRLLIALWDQRRCTFEEMAHGLACIDHILHEMEARETSQ